MSNFNRSSGEGGGFGGENIHDSLKALEEVRQDAEKGMFMFDGAIRLLHKQEEDSIKTGSCAVCHRRFSSNGQLQDCTDSLQLKKHTVMRVRNEEAVALRDTCLQAMSDLRRGNNHVLTNLTTTLTSGNNSSSNSSMANNSSDSRTPSATRLAFYLRTGELSEWRQQKLDCMTSMRCFACMRDFSAEEFSSFLKRVDHRAAVMERELHMHPKFCPVVINPVISSTSNSTCLMDSRSSSIPLSPAECEEGDHDGGGGLVQIADTPSNISLNRNGRHYSHRTTADAAAAKRIRWDGIRDSTSCEEMGSTDEPEHFQHQRQRHLAAGLEAMSDASSSTSGSPAPSAQQQRRELLI
jgi:hypothetical protein